MFKASNTQYAPVPILKADAPDIGIFVVKSFPIDLTVSTELSLHSTLKKLEFENNEVIEVTYTAATPLEKNYKSKDLVYLQEGEKLVYFSTSPYLKKSLPSMYIYADDNNYSLPVSLSVRTEILENEDFISTNVGKKELSINSSVLLHFKVTSESYNVYRLNLESLSLTNRLNRVKVNGNIYYRLGTVKEIENYLHRRYPYVFFYNAKESYLYLIHLNEN